MNINEWLEKIAFSIGDVNVKYGNIVGIVLSLLVSAILYIVIIYRFLPKLFITAEFNEQERRRTRRSIAICFFLLIVFGTIMSSEFDQKLYASDFILVKISNLVLAVLLWQAARLFDLVVSKALIHNYYASRGRRESAMAPYHRDTKESTQRMVQMFLYTAALLLIVNVFQLNYKIWSISINNKPFDIKVSSILIALLIILFARILTWIFTKIVLYRYYKRRGVEIGSRYAMNRLLSYFIYIVATLIALQSMGFNLTLIWGGLAALLLGVGLGLQQTFNDLASGIILLFERSVEVGDIVMVDNEVGIVKQIGLRTSLVETRNSTTIIVPNSKLIVETVVNWSHTDNIARFHVNVGVAYGSDTALVKKLLIDVANAHIKVMEDPPPFVRFIDFGDSSLNFELHFWSQELFRIENVKSDLRFEIDRVFRENNVTIPFPQRDVWFKNPLDNKKEE